jgi:hypothetical protein
MMDHTADIKTLIIVWPASAQIGSYFQIARPTQIPEERKSNIEAWKSREQLVTATRIIAKRDPKKMPSTGRPESIKSFDRCIEKSGISWHSFMLCHKISSKKQSMKLDFPRLVSTTAITLNSEFCKIKICK